MTVTAAEAHYILPPRMQYERADLPLLIPGYPLQPENWLQFTPPVLPLPAGSDLAEDWYVYWAIAKRLGRTIKYAGTDLDMQKAPTTEQLLALRMKGARVSFEELTHQASGTIFANDAWRVLPARPDATAKFDVMPADVAQEMAAFRAAPPLRNKSYPFLLSSRRIRDSFNSNGMQLSKVRARNPSNALRVHPDDLAALQLSSGDQISIASEYGRIVAQVKADATMRPGVVSMAHCLGGLPGAPSVDGENVNLLIDTTRRVESINAMPRMSAIPVRLAGAASE
jgi:anaerobic selenocysteine-containing dehydrogenase